MVKTQIFKIPLNKNKNLFNKMTDTSKCVGDWNKCHIVCKKIH